MLRLEKNGEILVCEIEDASRFFKRFMGLMYRKSMPPQHGLLLTPCNAIHTFGMRFPIDAITLSRDNEVLFIDSDVPPKKVRKKVDGGYKVLELNAGQAKALSIAVGDVLEFLDNK